MDKTSMMDIRRKNRSDVYGLSYRERRLSKSKIASARVGVGVKVLPEHVTAVVVDLYGAVIAKKNAP